MGHRTGRWRNIRSLVSAALTRVGLVQVPARIDQPPSPAWLELLANPLPRDAVYRLGRFARFCTAQGLDPDAVDDGVLVRFRAALDVASLVADPARSQRETARQWNRAAAAHPGWPQQRLSVPDHRLTYTPAWATYPPSLLLDVEAWMTSLAGSSDDLLSDDPPSRPLRPATLESHRTHLRLYLGALVLQGVDAVTMLDLRSVVTPELARLALRFFLDRAGGKASQQTAQIAQLVVSIGRYRLRLAPGALEPFRALVRRVTPPKRGMTPRNQTRLRPFQDEAVFDRLVALPNQLCKEVEDKMRQLGGPNASLARQYQTAVLIEVLLVVPLRIANLAGLRIGTHLIRAPDGTTFLVLAEDEVKNGQPLEVRLPAAAAKMIARYIDCFRSHLSKAAGDWLFPGRAVGTHKSLDGLRDQITTTLAERCGLTMHPHLFRHVAAMMTLRDNPAAHGQVQRILGHKRMSTTMSCYTGMETPAAMAHYQTAVLGRGEQTDLLPRRHR